MLLMNRVCVRPPAIQSVLNGSFFFFKYKKNPLCANRLIKSEKLFILSRLQQLNLANRLERKVKLFNTCLDRAFGWLLLDPV